MKHVIIMPDLGQTSSEAKIVSWLKNPGDKLAMGEPLLEVETDKGHDAFLLEEQSFEAALTGFIDSAASARGLALPGAPETAE